MVMNLINAQEFNERSFVTISSHFVQQMMGLILRLYDYNGR